MEVSGAEQGVDSLGGGESGLGGMGAPVGDESVDGRANVGEGSQERKRERPGNDDGVNGVGSVFGRNERRSDIEGTNVDGPMKGGRRPRKGRQKGRGADGITWSSKSNSRRASEFPDRI
jgi:hypothetical protein